MVMQNGRRDPGLPRNGNFVYGYVQPSGKRININRMGACSEVDSIDDVLVVWTATKPYGGSKIVGWYKSATVFRDYQKFKMIPKMQSKNGGVNEGQTPFKPYKNQNPSIHAPLGAKMP